MDVKYFVSDQSILSISNIWSQINQKLVILFF